MGHATPLRGQKISPQHAQIGQGKERGQLSTVFGQSSIAGASVAELALQHPKDVLSPSTNPGNGAVIAFECCQAGPPRPHALGDSRSSDRPGPPTPLPSGAPPAADDPVLWPR